jgi:acetate kinase
MANAYQAHTVLAINAGSSSLKFGLYAVGAGQAEILVSGEADAIGAASGTLSVEDPTGAPIVSEVAAFADPLAAAASIFRYLDGAGLPAPVAIGHRIVHGGPHCVHHALIDSAVLRDLDAARAFAPLHVPEALDLIGATRARYPGLRQVACLDTAFHAGMPDVARVLAVPKALLAEGVHRYGFHGLSCESIVRQLGRPLPRRLIIAHLGNGASVTAVLDGRSIDTSMGLTPTGGLVMGSRSGDLDPGVPLYLMRAKGLDADGLERLLDRDSGLLGISGLSNDVRVLRHAPKDDRSAALAIAMFAYAARKAIAGMIAALSGVDLLVFTGGIGEHDGAMRDTIMGGLAWAGIGQVRVVPSDENRQIALHTARIAG